MKRFFAVICVLVVLVAGNILASETGGTRPKSQEVSEIDGVPVLLKHLPDWESVRQQAAFATDISTLQAAAGNRSVLELIDFSSGTEAVTAQYPAGRLVIVEFSTPQASIDADEKFRRALESDPASTVYRRIGNYNAFVFDAADPEAAGALLDQVKYEKHVQWLGEDPFLFEKLERAFVITTTDIFLSTVKVIVLGIGISIIGGVLVGYFYFRRQDKKRLVRKEFTDAGGMTRLNLDGFTPQTASTNLLNE